MELNNFDQLVKKVTANVLQKLDVQVDPVTKDKACLVIQPNMNFGSKEYFDYILAKFPEYELYFGTEENPSKSQYMSRYKTINFITMKFDNPIFVKVLEYVNTIVVIGPKLNQLKALTQADDSDDINHLILGSLLADKSVTILVNLNESIGKKLENTIQEIREMGIHVVNLQQQHDTILDRVELITESHVLKLKENGMKFVVLNKKQLLTPLAKDRLKEFKIVVKYMEEVKK